MNSKEKQFVESIQNKIDTYNIPTTLKEVLEYYTDTFIETEYSDGTTELVDMGIEYRLCQLSAYYFIDNYAYIEIPGVGTLPFGLYYFQEETLKLLPDLKKTVFNKTRQCLTDKNYVMTNRGYISIKDVKPGDKIETIEDEKVKFVDVKDAWHVGKREVCRILTNSGAEVESTLSHKFFTKRGWVEAKDLTLDDEIVSIINKGTFGNFKLEKDEHAALIGYYLADGRASQPSFVNTNIDYINEVLEIGKNFKNCDAYIYERGRNKDRKQGYDVRLVSKTKANNIERPILDFMKRFNLSKNSVDRIFTNELMNLNEKQMSIMLNRLFAGDGYITYTQDKRRPKYIQYEIGIGAPNFTLVKQLEYILQTKYGIHCWVSEQYDKRFTQRFWKLRITQKKSVINFINKIGIKGKTDTKEIKELILKEKPYSSNQSFEKVKKIEKIDGLFDVYDIETSSSDFVSNELKVHNSGISTLTSVYCFWMGNFHESESIDVISTKQTKAQAYVAKMDATYKNMPLFLRTPVKNKNMHGIKWENGSQIISETASETAGRGDSLSLLVLDEAAHYQSDRLTRGIIGAAMPTLSRTGGSLIIISTPNGTHGSGAYYYEQVNQLQIKGNSQEERLVDIDWWEVPDIKGIKPYRGYNEKLQEFIDKDYYNNPVVKEAAKRYFKPIEENWRENDFLSKQYEDLGAVLFRQEIFHDFIIAEDQVLDDFVLEDLKNKIREHKPLQENELNGNQLKGLMIWNLPVPKRRYILSSDVSTGTGNDFSSFVVMDVDNYEQVAEFKGKTSTKRFGKIIKILAKYYNQAFVVIEANSIGEAVFNEVYYHDTDPYDNVYKQKKTKNGVSRFTGWETNSKTRQLMLNDLIDWLNVEDLRNRLTIKSPRIYQEMTTWVWKNGRPDHAEGCVSGDTLITTKNGIEKIEDIKEGDLVLTHNGNFKKVLKTYKFKDDSKKMLRISGQGMADLNITSNHEQYVFDKKERRFEFKSFDDIYNFNDYSPTMRFQEFDGSGLKIIDLLEFNKDYNHNDEFIFWSNNKGKQKINRFMEVDDDFVFILGHVLADGTVADKGNLFITCSLAEEPIKEVYERFANKNGLPIKYTYMENKKYFRIIISNIILWNMLKEIKTSENKKPIDFMWEFSKEQALLVTVGYFFGDGSFRPTHDNKSATVMSVTISKKIWNYISAALYSNKIKFNNSTLKHREIIREGRVSIEKERKSISLIGLNLLFFEKSKFSKYFYDCKRNFKDIDFKFEALKNRKNKKKMNDYKEDFLLANYTKVEQIEWSDYYYDLNVEDDHSYIANGNVVHNSHDDLLVSLGLCIHLRNKVTEYGDSFFIGDDGTLFQFDEEDKNREVNDGFGFETTEKIQEDAQDLIEERYGMDVDQYKWLLG